MRDTQHFVCTRRQFVKKTTLLPFLAGLWLSPSRVSAAKSKNDRLSIACIGLGGQGIWDMRAAKHYGAVVALCDVDRTQAETARKELDGHVDICQNYREILDRKDIDVVMQATPDHWHTKINIEACLAEKDVYAQKPLTYTIDEGKQLCRVVAQTKRIVQTGTQQRSDRFFQTAIELVRNRRIGPLKDVWVALPFYTTTGGPFLKEEVPPSLDWDLYQGPAPLRDYNVQRTHSTFRWWYEYAGGIVTDWGNHHIDIAHWGMDCEHTGPISIEARGMFPNQGRADHFNTPDRFFSRMMYENGISLLYFVSNNRRKSHTNTETRVEDSSGDSTTDGLFDAGVPKEIVDFDRDGIMFIGEQGRIFVNRGGVYGKAVDELAHRPLEADAWRVRPSSDHFGNFFACVRSRELPVAPVEIEHRSVTACHLTNISIRLGGRKLQWDPATETVQNDPEAQEMLRRDARKPYFSPVS